jgi:hypothetical protein
MAKKRKKGRSAAVEAAMELFRAWGREGGKKGAKARWGHLTPEERSAAAKNAAAARWSKSRKKKPAQ